MEGCFTFQWVGGGGGVCVSDVGFIVKWVGHPIGGINFDGAV